MLITNVIHFTRTLRDAGLPLGALKPPFALSGSEGFDAGRTLRCAQGERFRVS
ncbi:MAG: hypothetical protein H7203_04560 [Rhizobacter sp.]|nr:hypothetical protein [Burkholderiales bacterium]